LQEEFDELAVQFENHPHVRLVLRCEETLTHNIFAGADLFVIPSIFEPCGLTQVSLEPTIAWLVPLLNLSRNKYNYNYAAHGHLDFPREAIITAIK